MEQLSPAPAEGSAEAIFFFVIASEARQARAASPAFPKSVA
jgi:hypothetical protein